MNYNEALEYIHGTKKFGSKLGLENIKMLLKLLGDPHKGLKVIHIAGTNGKGSTASFIENILKEEGYKVGLYTSPYLERFNERIKINNEDIPDHRLADVTAKVKNKVEEMVNQGYNHPTEFEIVTAIAFQYYKEEAIDYLVLEVGLGGRYDSTNVIEKPLASVITTISMDHTDILGDTIEKIAWEKAGIIKHDCLVISYPQEKGAEQVINEVAKSKNAKLIYVPTKNIIIKEISEYGSIFSFKYQNCYFDNLKINIIGEHQIFNAATAVTTLLELRKNDTIKLKDNSIRNGLLKARWHGRLELLKRDPIFLIDGAHNLQGIMVLKKTINNIFKNRKIVLGIGILKDKDVDNMVSQLVPLADKVIVTEPNIYRAMKAEELAEKVAKYNSNYYIEKDIVKAVNKAYEVADKNDVILFSGSLYLIGDVRKIVNKK